MGVSNFFDIGKMFLRLDYQMYFGDKTGHRLMPALGFNFEKRNWSKLSRFRVFPSVSVLLGSENSGFLSATVFRQFNFYPKSQK
ncbi:MAG: hypothetical protein ACK5V5_04455 [Cyclobacteriaceae bacterium]|nr:hypothetical protein [Flammeovirgaceae bacterium]